MKKDTINLILGGVGVVVALIALSPKGEGKDGSESGGFQLPSFLPQGAGAGEASPGTTTNNYNISFPEAPSFPGMETKKESAVISGVGSLGVPYTGFGYDAKTGIYTSGLGSGAPGYEPLKSVSHAPAIYTTKKQSVQTTGTAALKANITAQPTYGQTSSKSIGGMGKTYTKRTYVAGKTTHAYK